MTIEVDVRHQLGAFSLNARFAAGPGVTALFGRSGSGKTTIVNIIAGLVRPQSGRVVVDGETLVDTGGGIFVPAHRRRVGYVFQDARLFPHLTVRQNMLYGAWFTGRSAAAVPLEAITEMLGLAPLLERSPRHLSGGEKQRVAIGRALLAAPRVLLMDEPLAALDDARKHEIMPYLERLRDDGRVPVIYVTHSITEVARLATTLAVVADGCVAAFGPPAEVTQRLDLVALMNAADASVLIEARVLSHDEAYGLTVLRSRAGQWRVPRLETRAGTQLRLAVRASDVMVSLTEPAGISALNVFPARIDRIGEPHGARVEVKLDCNGDMLIAQLTRYSLDRLKLTPGTAVFVLIKSVAIDQRWPGVPSRPGD